MTTDQAIRLVYRDLKGTIRPEERRALRAWETADAEHRRTAEDIRRAWQATAPATALPFALDVEADFERVRTRIQPAAKIPVVRLQPRRRPWLRIAAALVFVLLSVVALRLAFQDTAAEWTTAYAESAAGPLQLPDGSRVWLAPGAELAYPTQFAADQRPVRLRGKAFFEVAKAADRPFTVATNRVDVTVLGTAFQVDDAADVPVSVREGKVRVSAPGTETAVVLVAGENVRFTATRQLEKYAAPDGNARAWQRGYLKFSNTPLPRVLADLEAHYGTAVRTTALSDACRLTGRYDLATSLPDLLDAVATSFGATRTGTAAAGYVLTGGTCQ